MKRILLYFSFFLILAGIRVNMENSTPEPCVATASTSCYIQEQLIEYIKVHDVKPIAPRLDSVFHFVPGIDGQQIDFELSYQNMLSNGSFDPSLIVATATQAIGNPHEFRAHRMYKGNEKSNNVGLLVNVAWGSEELDQILSILDEHNVRASFFFEGKFADKHRHQVLDVFNRGHVIGNHSYSHPAAWLSFGYDEFLEEIVKTNEILTSITGQDVLYFAPPGGAFTDDTVKAAYDSGMFTILWSADSIDWRGEPAHVLTERVLNRIEPGGLILTHPKPETVKALPDIITNIRNRGLEFTCIDNIVHGNRYFGSN